MSVDDTSTADDDMREAYRVGGHVVRAIMGNRNKEAADLIRTFDSPQNLSIVLASGLALVLSEMREPDALIDAYFWQDEPQSPVRPELAKTAQARELIKDTLADGKKHSYVKVRALALARGLSTRDLANAGRQLEVLSGNVNVAGHWWQWNPAVPHERRRRVSKTRSQP